MSLTAEDIQTKQFHVRFRGFDIEEVDTFLERIAENFALLNEEKRQLKEKVEKLEMEINKFQSQEKTFQHAIISAQRIADEMQEKSRQEANARRTAVLEEIDRLRKKSTEEKETLEREIAILQKNKNKVREELRIYLQSYLSWLDQDGSLADNVPLSQLQTDVGDERQSPPPPKEQAIPADEERAADLYEKIDIPDDYPSREQEKIAPALREDRDDDAGEEEGEKLTIPDLDGDMLFSLEDPLDKEQGPRVSEKEPPEDKFFRDIKMR